jgi:Ig-like domain-containing protein
MNTTSISRVLKIMIFGMLIFASACSPLMVIVQPTNVAPSPTVLPTIASTSTLAPTMLPTSSPTAIPLPTATSVPASTDCQDSAQYISDDGLDGATYSPNTLFTKTWTVKNTGTCTWDSSYLVFQISGTYMTQQPGYWIVPQGQTVSPGQTVNIIVGMTGPVENGNYASYWGLKKENGQLMRIQGGANGNSFYVKIKVNDGSVATGKVTAASIAIELEQGSGAVCTTNSTYFVHVSITADGPSTASYEIGSTAGQIPAGNFQDANNGLSPYVTGSLTFDQAGTKTINLRFVGPYPYPSDITVNLRVNGGAWHNTKLSCQ